MDLQKAKIYLDKINREFARMSKDPENIVRIERDIMLTNVRELYEAFISDEIAAMPTVVPPAPKPSAPPRMAEPEVPALVVPPPPPPPPPAPVVREEPTVVVEPAPVVRAPEPIVIAPKMPVSEPVAPAPDMPKPSAAAKISIDADALFEQKQARELSEKLAAAPIPDLRRGISLNDRLLFTGELFGKDNQLFEDTLAALNNCTGFEQAKAYLVEYIVERFDWLEKSRASRAKDFIRLVHRRFK